MTRGAAFYQEYFRDGSQDPIGCLVFGSKNGTGKFWIISLFPDVGKGEPSRIC